MGELLGPNQDNLVKVRDHDSDHFKHDGEVMQINLEKVGSLFPEGSIPASAVAAGSSPTFSLIDNVLTLTNAKGQTATQDLSTYINSPDDVINGLSITGDTITATTISGGSFPANITDDNTTNAMLGVVGTDLVLTDSAGNTVEVPLDNIAGNDTANTYVFTQDANGVVSVQQKDIEGNDVGAPQIFAGDTDDQSVQSSDESVIVTPAAQPDGQVDYDITNPNPLIDPGSSKLRMSATGSSISIGKDPDTHQTNEVTLGASAGKNAVGGNTVYVGTNAGFNTESSNSVAVGNSAAAGAVGSINAFLGSLSGYLVQAVGVSAIGYNSARENTGNYLAAVGHSSGSDNVGINVTALGARSGVRNTANYLSAGGYNSGSNNSGNQASFFGYSAGTRNISNKASAFGYNAGTVKIANPVTVPVTIDPATNQVIAPSHGYGVAGDRLWVQIDATTVPTGLSSGWYWLEVVDADTLLFVSGRPTTAGDGVTIATDVNTALNNWTVLGHNAQPTASNQVTLGDNGVAEVVSAGDAVFNGTFYASDKRLKKVKGNITNATSRLSELDVVNFTWDFDSKLMQITPAQEWMEEVEPAEYEEESVESSESVEPSSETPITSGNKGKKTKRKLVKPAKFEKRNRDAVTVVPKRMEGKEQIGIIAQQVQKVFPEAVTERRGVLTVDYPKLSMVAIAAVKELNERLNALEGSSSKDTNADLAFRRLVNSYSVKASYPDKQAAMDAAVKELTVDGDVDSLFNLAVKNI